MILGNPESPALERRNGLLLPIPTRWGRRALFIDAAQGVPAPCVFHETAAGARRSPTTHALSPEAVLAVLPLVGAAPPPAAFVLGVRGDAFVLGEAPGTAAPRPLRCSSGFVETPGRRPGMVAGGMPAV